MLRAARQWLQCSREAPRRVVPSLLGRCGSRVLSLALRCAALYAVSFCLRPGLVSLVFPHMGGQAFLFLGPSIPYPTPWTDAPFALFVTQQGLKEVWTNVLYSFRALGSEPTLIFAKPQHACSEKGQHSRDIDACVLVWLACF